MTYTVGVDWMREFTDLVIYVGLQTYNLCGGLQINNLCGGYTDCAMIYVGV